MGILTAGGFFILALMGFGVLILFVVIWLIGAYNKMVRYRNEVKNSWSQIDVQLKRRYDLIPNLVETVKGYASHERETMEAVIQARTRAVDARTVGEQAEAENMLSAALGRLMMLSEAYPDLKANQNFLSLQEELTSTENKIGFSRQHYNDSVMQFNTLVQSFPNNLISGMFNFNEEEFFEVKDAVQREAPKVQF